MPFGIPREDFHGGFGLYDEEAEHAAESGRDELIDDLNLILKSNFDYVPIYKTVTIADALTKKGWEFNKRDDNFIGR